MRIGLSVTATAAGFVMAAMLTPAMAQQTGITVGMVLEPPNLDPTAGAAAAIDEVVYANVFEGLTRFDESGAVQPALAESWDISEDGLTYTFALHEGVTFHDGTEMDSADVKFSLERAMAEDSTNAQPQLFEDIASVEAPEPQTVVITLSEPNGRFTFNLAWGDAVIVGEESAGSNATNPVGTGPFSFEEWVQGDRVELAAYADYWGEAVALESATFKFISDPNAAFAAMMAGDVDAFPNFPATETLPQFEADPRFKVIVGSTEGETIMAMNNARPPLDNVQVREAIAHAIDRQEIIDGAMFGYGTPIGTFFAPHNPAYVDLTDRSDYDPERARELLAEAGYSEGFEATLKLPPPTYARRGGEIIAAQLREVGVDVAIENVEWAQWLEGPFGQGDYDFTIVSHTEPMDFGQYANPDYYFNYQNEAFNEVIAELSTTTDEARRTELMQEAQTILAEDYASVFLFQLAKTGVANADIEGLWANSPTQANDLTNVRWTE